MVEIINVQGDFFLHEQQLNDRLLIIHLNQEVSLQDIIFFRRLAALALRERATKIRDGESPVVKVFKICLIPSSMGT
jgi:hypothetical protein